MTPRTQIPILTLVALLLAPLAIARAEDSAPDASFPKFAIASVHPLATQAGLQAFEKGGNAIDAVIAAGLTLGVVDGHNSGIGGGCFIVIRSADGTVTCIDGAETTRAIGPHPRRQPKFRCLPGDLL